MAKRHKDALDIQIGAVNPLAISNVFADACRSAYEEGGGTDAVWNDPAIRLMVHQLYHLTNVREINHSLICYQELIKQCEQLSIKAA